MQESEVSHESETSSPTFALAAAFQSRQLRNLPNLFVVGAAKSGTTALYEYFRKHPQVFVPNTVKEANFMAFHEGLPPLRGPGDLNAVAKKSITQLDDYLQIFSDRRSEPVAADVSPAYLYFPESAFKIKELCPHAKIVMVLRNPVECAFSMYSMLRRDRREPCRSFSDAFRFTDKRLTDGWQWFWDYPGGWKYSDQVETYLNLFPGPQLFIRRYEQLKHRPESFYGELTQFLGICAIDLTTANRPVNTARGAGKCSASTAPVGRFCGWRRWQNYSARRMLPGRCVDNFLSRRRLCSALTTANCWSNILLTTFASWPACWAGI